MPQEPADRRQYYQYFKSYHVMSFPVDIEGDRPRLPHEPDSGRTGGSGSSRGRETAGRTVSERERTIAPVDTLVGLTSRETRAFIFEAPRVY